MLGKATRAHDSIYGVLDERLGSARSARWSDGEFARIDSMKWVDLSTLAGVTLGDLLVFGLID